MKNKHDEGFSLVELLVAIVILTAIVVPTCSALVMTNEMNNRSDDLMKAQLAVSSAVEILMAEGISSDKIREATPSEWTDLADEDFNFFVHAYEDTRFPSITIFVAKATEKGNEAAGWMPWYAVRVTSSDGLVEVETTIKDAVTEVANDKT